MSLKAIQATDYENLEMKLLIDAVYQKYGYDFRNYAHASFKRRLVKARIKHDCKNIAEILYRTLTEPDFFSVLINDLTVTVTELFRDPSVYRAVREEIVPHLKTYPEIKVWCAGCAAGEEVFSLAILLEEEGLYNHSILYGTDINPLALECARDGIVSLAKIKDGTKNYFEAGGKQSLTSYYTAEYDAALLRSELRENLVFSDHNLATDGVFGEMQLIFCRNTLIYFNRDLQDRAIGLFRESLCPGGFLCLGAKESLSLSKYRRDFEEIGPSKKIYRKKW